MKIFIIVSGLAIVFLLFCTKRSYAQADPHFSQYYANPLYLNPALTGVIDGAYRVTLNVKRQWGAIERGFLTGGASFDIATKKNIAFGVTVLNQAAGDLDFNYFTGLVSGSYRLKFGEEGFQVINFGLQGGIINRSLDYSKARFGNQFNAVSGFDGAVSDAAFSSQSAILGDVITGLMYFDSNPNKKVNVFFGAALAHLNRPVDQFAGSNARIPVRMTLHGGTRIRASEFVDIVPDVLCMWQGNTRELSIGAYTQLNLEGKANIILGGNYRVDDASIAYLGLKFGNMTFGLSYDIHRSTLRQTSNSSGGLELSLSFIGRKGMTGSDFFYPRL